MGSEPGTPPHGDANRDERPPLFWRADGGTRPAAPEPDPMFASPDRVPLPNAIPPRICTSCGAPGDDAHHLPDGSFRAWYCVACDHRHGRKRTGWRRRVRYRVRRLGGL